MKYVWQKMTKANTLSLPPVSCMSGSEATGQSARLPSEIVFELMLFVCIN
jgi:hypothetical protein